MARNPRCLTQAWKCSRHLLKFLRPHLYPRLERLVLLVSFAPGLEMNGVQEQHSPKQFERADAARPLQLGLRRLNHSLLQTGMRSFDHDVDSVGWGRKRSHTASLSELKVNAFNLSAGNRPPTRTGLPTSSTFPGASIFITL